MIGYLIDASERIITKIAYEYGDFTKWIPGGITVGAVYKNGDVLYVDDEGLLRPAERAFRVRSRPDGQPMMSNGFLTGRDSIRGDITLPPTMSVIDLLCEIEWLTVDQALAWFRERAHSPAVTVNDVPIAYWQEMLDHMEGWKF